MAAWNDSLVVPDWLVAGARVVHTTFGRGAVGHVGIDEQVPTVWVDFESGETKAVSLELGLQFLEPDTRLRLPRLTGLLPSLRRR